MTNPKVVDQPVRDDPLQADAAVSEAVEGEPGELCCQLTDQAGELKTELFSLQLEISGGSTWQQGRLKNAHLEDLHNNARGSAGEIVMDCLGVVYPLPHIGHACELLLINVPC